MLFPTHLLAAAIVGKLSRLSVVWLVVGTALPDLVDKPLASLGITSLFHSVGHSALLAVVAIPLALSGRAGLSAVVGWLLHLALDVLHLVINGRPADAVFLLWPITMPTDPLALPPGAFVRHYLWSPSFVLEVVFWLGVGGLFVRKQRAGTESL